MNTKIHILSQPVHSGKTSMLIGWLRLYPDAGGILTPDMEGRRKLYDIESKTLSDLEVDAGYPGAVPIGIYHFDPAVLQQAQQVILKALAYPFSWVVIDEVGKLEVEQHKGLEPAVSTVINYYKNNENAGNLLLVIRDYLLDRCITQYGLKEAVILDKTFFL